ncbi:MAG: AMP-binding protein [Lachnospiraceae bacterium]|nr:AMP-binding protein [Lachnospiraceae bacterium]
MQMMRFMEKFFENCRSFEKDAAVINAKTGAKISYGELYELSGKVYAYLKSNGIGRESVVMISLPRGVQPFIALVGIWRAGAAAVMLEPDFAAERRDYIYKDASCRLLIDTPEFARIMDREPIDGYEKTSPHDLAYLVYTSGTTGKPKGAMQEYGVMEMCAKSDITDRCIIMDRGDRMAILSPLNFAATILNTFPLLYFGGTLVIYPMDIVKDPTRLTQALGEYKISIIFVTSTLLRHLGPLPDSIVKVLTGGEPAKNLYIEGVDMYCMYGQSESCFTLASFLIDRPYDMTPVGKCNISEADLCILDDQGNRLPDGTPGNICYKSPYFRGYLGMPEETEKCHINDYHISGDIGRIENGNLIIQGRSDDMIKINGNRVEPAEIEIVLKGILGVEWVGVKGFSDENSTYICAYHIGTPSVSVEEAKASLANVLPSYMIPSFIIHLDSIPLNENGKFSRKDLPAPDLSSYRKDYVEPADKYEEALCSAMAGMLGLDRVGALDDFYDLGASSILAMRLIEEAKLPQLDISMVIRGRCARDIAKLYRSSVVDAAGPEMRNAEALSSDQPLTITQLYMFDYQCYVPKSTTWNLNMLLCFSPNVDIPRVKEAVERVLAAHPVFSTIYCFNDNTDLVQRYVPDMDLSVDIEQITEAQFIDVRETLIQPYKLLNSRLYRIRLFQTERAGYLYIDMHHSISDGTSIQILIRDICNAYEGKELEKDYYYMKVVERNSEESSDLYREAKEYYAKVLDNVAWDCFPKIDHEITVNGYGNITTIIPVEDIAFDKLQKQYGITKTAFFITAALITIATYNKSDDIRVSWIFNGREKESDRNIVGTLIRNLFVGIRFKRDTTIGSLYKDVLQQIEKGIVYSCYPYPGPEHVNDEGIDASIIYQSDLRTITRDNRLEYFPLEIPKNHEAADNLMDIEIQETEDGCMLYMDYIAECYEPSSINRFKKIFLKTACLLVQYADEPDSLTDRLRKEADSE